MNLVLSFVLAAALLPANAFVHVRIIYVNTQYVTITKDYSDEVNNAFAYWYRNAPQVVSHEIIDTTTIHVDNPFSNAVWLTNTSVFEGGVLDIYIIANRNELLFSQYAGVAVHNYNSVLIVEKSLTGFEPTLAHELGHILYNLPDWYTSPGKCSMDIMCYAPRAAYSADRLGCRTLEYLGGKCHYVYLPSVIR